MMGTWAFEGRRDEAAATETLEFVALLEGLADSP